jgi:adenylosuccinate synthase
MKKVEVVIGSAFGDEGKGLVTDFLSSRRDSDACVVRFNGGAQAGHTVEMPDGRRHVFSHFGSGSFAGLPTYLSSFFVCNPIIFLRERAELIDLGVAPPVFVDASCPVTTPYDIMINQVVEQMRGKGRHGSVGVGFGETLERHSHAPYALSVRDLADSDLLRTKLEAISSKWVFARLAHLGIATPEPIWLERFRSEAIRERFIADCAAFLNHVTPSGLNALAPYDHLIFEGAQGLLLDQTRGWFPHVTRSNTGLTNVLALAEQIDMSKLDVFYLTRSYTTRHGAGPLPNELAEQPYRGIEDKTNRPNPYQGALRFAWFDLDLFRQTVMRDLADTTARFDIAPHVSVSCLDQIDHQAGFIAEGSMNWASDQALVSAISQAVGAETALMSYGPTRATMQEMGRFSRNRPDCLFQPINVQQNNLVAV